MPARSVPSTEHLRQLFDYDPDTGSLTWRSRPGCCAWNTRYSGKPAGTIKRKRNGRPTGIAIDIDGVSYHAHRIIWALVTGGIPLDREVDHRDCDPLNNRWSNLRLATDSQNSSNSRLLRRTLSGCKGVKRHRDRYQARIKVNGKSRHLGTFRTLEEARAAYHAAAQEAFGEFARA